MDFIGDQQDAMRVAQRPQRLHESRAGDIEPAFSFDRLDDDCGNTTGLDIIRE